MKYSIKILQLFVFLGGIVVQAQETSPSASEDFTDDSSALYLLASLEESSSKNLQQEESSVYIDQIGRNNTIYSNLRVENSELKIVQDGEGNQVLLDIAAKEIEQQVMQHGNNNNFFNIGNDPSAEQTAKVIQNGTNQDVTIYGENSLSGDIKINMQGNDKSLLIRNF